MRLRTLIPIALGLVLAISIARSQRPRPAPAAVAAESISFRVTFGYLRVEPKQYDGSVSVTGGQLLSLEPWRFFEEDAVVKPNGWKLNIKRIVFENQPDKPNPLGGGLPGPRNLVPAGVILTVSKGSSSVEMRTAQGIFSIPVGQLKFGKHQTYLDGDVVVERVPSTTQVSESAEEHDFPSIVTTRAGVTWTAWQAYRDRGDHVYAKPSGGTAVRLTDQRADVFQTAISEDADGAIHVMWTEQINSDWQLIERQHVNSKWLPRRQITSGEGPNTFHRLAGNRLVWVSHAEGKSWLSMAAWNGSEWSAPQRIGGPSVWSPDASLDAQGNLHVAWDSYQNGNYDIFYRRIGANGTPGALEQVTSSPRFQAHASVAVDRQGRAWLAWDESGANWGKDWNHEDMNRATTLYADRSIRVAVKDGSEWKQAGDFSTAVDERLRRYWELPKLAVDGRGRVWALFQIRTAAQHSRDDFWCSGGLWDLYLTTFEDGVWKPASFVPHSTARPEAPFRIAAGTDRVWMTWATDGRKLGPVDRSGATSVKYDVFTAEAAAAGGGGEVKLSALAEPTLEAQLMHPKEEQDVRRIREYRTTAAGKTYRIVRGDFHRHTEISSDGSGDGSVEDFYRYMIDAAQMDTEILGDHNMGGDVEYSWWRTEKSNDIFRIRNRFLPLYGYERSVPYPNGHRNVVFDHRGVRTLPLGAEERKGQLNSGAVVYPYLRQNRGICMEHSLATGQGTDYRDNDPNLEPLVELYQGYHASYEYKGAPRAENDQHQLAIHSRYEPAGFWWNALAKGLKLGVQASSDHISTHCSYAMVFTPAEDRTQIVENMRARHAYAATDNIVVDFSSEGHLMGEAFETQSAPRVKARIIGTDKIVQVDLVRNNEFIYTRSPGQRESEFEYSDTSAKPGEHYYYVRIRQEDGNLAWSSPIWVKHP